MINTTAVSPRGLLAKLQPEARTAKFWVTLFLFSCFTIFAMGREGKDILTYGIWLYLSLYVLKRMSNKFFVGYLLFTFAISSVYLPIAVMYGRLNKGTIPSLFETNMQESVEFLAVMSPKSYVCLILYILIFVLLLKINKKMIPTKKVSKKLYVLAFIVFLAIFVKPIQNSFKNGYISSDGLTYYPLRQVAELYNRTDEYFTNKEILRQSRESSPVWDFESKNLKYKTYVLVIGESMRRDYMSAYGFHLETTPFLDKTNGVFFDNFISPSQNTRLSLERMLFHNKAPEQSIVSNTPVSFANSLDMDTYWISNQGVYGKYDVFASSVAVRSDKQHFLKQGQAAASKSYSDLELLPKFDEIVTKSPKDKPKLIVVHLMGSHSSFCQRLDENYGISNITDYGSKDLSCYLSTYRQTDKLLQKIYNKLKKTDESFSMMYLSDHGLVHKKQGFKGVTLRHDTEYKQDYEVPFLTISSDDTRRTHIKAERSGYYFMNGFAEWLGVEERQLRLSPKFFSDVDNDTVTKVFNGTAVVDYHSLEDDPAIMK